MKRITILLIATVLGVVLVSGVALAAAKRGTDGNDTIRGTTGSDALSGLGGRDYIVGRKGADAIAGGSGDDILFGSDDDRIPEDKSPDAISGGSGNDDILGGQGADSLRGGRGDDFIVHGPFVTNAGAVDKSEDAISCGPGDDYVVAGRGDKVSSDCEAVSRISGVRAANNDKQAQELTRQLKSEQPSSAEDTNIVTKQMVRVPPSESSSEAEEGQFQAQNSIEGDCGISYFFIRNLGGGLAGIDLGFNLFEPENIATRVRWGYSWFNNRTEGGDRYGNVVDFSPPRADWSLGGDLSVIVTGRGLVEGFATETAILTDGGVCTSYYSGESLSDRQKISNR